MNLELSKKTLGVVILILTLFIGGQMWLINDLFRIIDLQDKTVDMCCNITTVHVDRTK